MVPYPPKNNPFPGASNLSNLPKFENNKIQVVSNPGARLGHAYHILRNKTVTAPEVQIVILNFGLNNRKQGNVTILNKTVERLSGAAILEFPSALIFFQLINYDKKLPTHVRENLDFLNEILKQKTQHIPLLPAKSFRTVQDNIHWTRETGEAMARHWLEFLKL